MNLNKIFLIGRLTRDPESKALPSGTSVVTFGLATSRFYKDKSGQRQQQTEFHNVVLFNKIGDVASRYLRKGDMAFIEGRVQTRSWQDQSGNKRSRTEVVGEVLQLGPKKQGGQEEAPPKENEKGEEKEEDIPIIEEEEVDPKNIPF